jgi:hypothetical protein
VIGRRAGLLRHNVQCAAVKGLVAEGDNRRLAAVMFVEKDDLIL